VSVKAAAKITFDAPTIELNASRALNLGEASTRCSIQGTRIDIG
jgi:hypothetical protein